ncbi:LlaJI family restriction endonuclease [Enterobacter hormaechei]|uniref:LlaJI family restriction endonuclease n=1 Tax=Enterobacteriaceae TaxID=543 RepID=UPI003B88A2E1
MLIFYSDRSNVNILPTDLRGFLTSKGLIVEDDIFIHFVGLVYFGGKPYIFLPRNSDVNAIQQYSTVDKEKISRELLLSIHMYQQSKKNSIDNRDNGEGFIGEENLTLLISLLDDFNLNGLYKRRSRRKIFNAGKINWKKTINSFQAYPSDHSPLYLEYEGIEKRIELDSEISKIHAGIISDISKNLGWLTYSDLAYYENELSLIERSELSTENQLVITKKELDTIYSERDIYLLKSIRKYIKKSSGYDKSDIIIGIREFHGMWEYILGSIFNNREKINSKLAAPVYKISGEFILAPLRGQRTDIVIKIHDNYFIIDAKYYEASNANNAPSLSDIIKQFYYVKSLGLVEKDAKKITNIFIFPGQKGKIESIHMALKEENNNSNIIKTLDEHYPPIFCIYKDPITLINFYANGKKINFIFPDDMNIDSSENDVQILNTKL